MRGPGQRTHFLFSQEGGNRRKRGGERDTVEEEEWKRNGRPGIAGERKGGTKVSEKERQTSRQTHRQREQSRKIRKGTEREVNEKRRDTDERKGREGRISEDIERLDV